MPIYFSNNLESGYFNSKYVGKMKDDDLIEYWKSFLESDEWIPGLNELADLSDADLKEITSAGVRRLSAYIESVYEKHGILSVKVGIYAPKDLPFGLSRMYEVMSDKSPEEVGVFRDRQEAENWVTK